MDNASLAKDLLQSAVNYHGSLVRLARGTERLRELMDFIVRCIDFAERNFPRPTYAHWIAENPFIPLIAERSKPLFSFQSIDPEIELDHLLTSGSTGSTHAYSFITGNFNFLETKAARDEFGVLSNLYRGLLSRPEDVNRVHVFLAPLNVVAMEKFDHSLASMASLPQEEDPQGPLLEMRSAIDLMLRSLLEKTPLTKRERGDLKAVQVLPAIANHLARDELSKVDLILANDQLEKLKSQLSAAKDAKLPRELAASLMSQSVALLNQIAKSIQDPSQGSSTGPTEP